MSRWVWGVDTSSYRMAVCALNPEDTPRHVLFEAESGPLDGRLARLAFDLSKLAFPQPSAVLIEQPSGRFRSPAIGAAYGAAMVGLRQNMLCAQAPFFYPTPAEWKAKTVGKGGATKAEVAEWAFGEGFESSSQDEIDAFAIAAWGILELRYEAAA